MRGMNTDRYTQLTMSSLTFLLMLLPLLLSSVPAGSSVRVSNTKLRRTKLGNVVGAQDGNLVNKKWQGQYALVGMS